MKAIVLQENLRQALSFVTKNISTKTQLPVLSNILIETETGRLKLSATNLETSISFWVGAQIEKEGALTVPARFLSELVNSFAQDKIELSAQGSNLKITCGRSEATLAGIAAEEFPPLPKLNEQNDAIIDKKLLETGLTFVLIAASSDEGRPLLTGIKFKETDKALLMVATDGYRLSVKELPKTKGFSEGFVLPAKALAEVFRLATEEKTNEIKLYFSKDNNQIIFTLENAQISTRLIEGEYPVFERIIPSSFTTRALFDKQSLLRAVKFAAVYAKESANIIKLNISGSTLTISANTPQIGENKTSIEIKSEGEGGEIAFNARFLIDLLTVFPEEEGAFEMSGPLAPGVFKPVKDTSFLHIIMPVRVQN